MPVIDMISSQPPLARLIKSRRKELNIKQEELSELSGIALRSIRDMEKGLGNPSIHSIEKVMEVLGIVLEFKLRK